MSNPYTILGVSKYDSIGQIEETYKKFMMLLHPDKANSVESRKLNLSMEQRSEYMSVIKNAYSEILNTRREQDFPDYSTEYSVGQDHRINKDPSLSKDFNSNKFNKTFNQGQERDRSAGMTDPTNRGYGEFDSGKNYNNNNTIGSQSYSENVSVTAPVFTTRPEIKDNKLIAYEPEFLNTGSAVGNFEELGLSNISDFSIESTGKGGLGGTDLMSVYGSNHEYWEDTVKRDSILFSKFNDSVDLSRKMESYNTGRHAEENSKEIYKKDYGVGQNEQRRKITEDAQEKMRISNMSKRDEYYNDINRGMLESADYGVRRM